MTLSFNSNPPQLVTLTGTNNVSISGTTSVNITNATVPISGAVSANITNSSIAVTGSLDANITNATLAVTGTVSIDTSGGAVAVDATGTINIGNTPAVTIDTSGGSVDANITNASIPVTGSIDANITNATLEITTSSSSPPNFNVANAIEATITSGTVTIADQVSTSIDAQNITLDTTANVSNTLLSVNPLQDLPSGSESLTIAAGATGNFNVQGGSPMLLDEIWLIVATSVNPPSSYTFQVGNLVQWSINDAYYVVAQDMDVIAVNGNTAILKLAVPTFVVTGFTINVTNNTSSSVSETFVIDPYARYATAQTGTALPPGKPIDTSLTLSTAGTVYTVAAASPTRSFFMIQNTSGDNVYFGFGSSSKQFVLYPGQGYENPVSKNPFITLAINAVGTVANQDVGSAVW